MNQKLKLLIIENDNDKVKSIENHLGKEFFEIDGVNSLKDGLDKLLIENSSMPICKYDVIVLNINGNFPLQEIIQFFREIRAKELDKPNCAFILFKNPQEEVNVVNQILSGKSFHIINTDDYSNDLYKLEQAILTTVPRAFHYYRKKIEICISGIEEKKTAVDNLMKIIDGIDKETKKIGKLNDAQKDFKKNFTEFEKKYVSWEKIIESLGILVGAFSLVMAIILAWLFNLSKSVLDLGCLQLSFVEFLVYSILIFALWAWVFYAILKNRINRMVDKEIQGKLN